MQITSVSSKKTTLYHQDPAFCCIYSLFSVICFLSSSAKASPCTSGVWVLFSVLKNPAFACPACGKSASTHAARRDPELWLQFLPVCRLQEPSTCLSGPTGPVCAWVRGACWLSSLHVSGTGPSASSQTPCVLDLDLLDGQTWEEESVALDIWTVRKLTQWIKNYKYIKRFSD